MRFQRSRAVALVLAVVVAVGTGCTTSRGWKTADSNARAEAETARRAGAAAHFMAGVVHELNQRPEEAARAFLAAARADLANEPLVLDVARRLQAFRQPEAARDLLRQAAELPGASGALLAELGRLHAQLGQPEAAFQANRLAVKKSPRLFAGYHNLFAGYLEARQPEAARKVLTDAARHADDDPEFLVSLAELHLAFGRQFPAHRQSAHGAASNALHRAQTVGITNATLRMRVAEARAALGDAPAAAALYQELLASDEELPLMREVIRARLAEMYLRSNDPQRASELLEAMIRDNPANPRAHFHLGSLAFEQKDYARAVEHFQRTILLAPDFQPAHYDLAVALLNLQRPAEALEVLARARTRFPAGFLLEYLTALAHQRQQQYAQATRHYTAAEILARAAETNRLNELFYFQMGAAFERAGDYAQAERCFEEALARAPDFDEALNYLGYMWAERGVNLERARRLIERAVELQPDNPAYLDSLGWVWFKLGDPPKALGYLLKAIQHLKEPDATIFDHLGDVYAALGQLDRAREAWEKSLAIEASDVVRQKLAAPDAR